MTNEKYLIAVDLDGTLLTKDTQVSTKTKTVLQYLLAEGHEVTIATGRPYRSSKLYYNEIGMHAPMVNFNGAYVLHPTDNRFPTFHAPLGLSVVKEIVDSMESLPMFNLMAEVLDEIYLHEHDEQLLNVFMMGNPKLTEGDIRLMLKNDPTSILVHADAEHIPMIRKHLDDVHAEVIDHRTWGAPWHVVEIVKTGINKSIGLTMVGNHLQIPRERIIAFGDEDNDIEMLTFAGTGVAMGNAINRVKEVADVITDTNNEDGIANFLIKKFDIPTAVWKK